MSRLCLLRFRVLVVLFASALATIVTAAAPETQPPPATPAKDDAPRYPFHGVILGVFADKGALLIKHDDVPGLMKGMKMAFRVGPEVFSLVKEGDTIDATLIVREDDFWLENVKPVKKS